MLLRRLGQSIIEYSALIALLFAAILIGGPILKRSIFGYLRMEEDSIMDTFSEDILQDTPMALLGCDCSSGGLPSTFSGACGQSPCAANQRMRRIECSPSPTCGYAQSCVTDSSCCAETITYGRCGIANVAPVASTGYPGCSPTRASASEFVAQIPGALVPCPAPQNGCLPGEQIISKVCGVSTVSACQPQADCYPSCGPARVINSGYCDDPGTHSPRADLVTEKDDRELLSGVADPLELNGQLSLYATTTPLNYEPYVGQTAGAGSAKLFWYYFAGIPGLPPGCSTTRKCMAFCQNPVNQATISTAPAGVAPKLAQATCLSLTNNLSDNCWYEIRPTFQHESCMDTFCFRVTETATMPATQGAHRETAVAPMPMARDFTATVSSDNLVYGLGCIGPDGIITSEFPNGTFLPDDPPPDCSAPAAITIPVPGGWSSKCFTPPAPGAATLAISIVSASASCPPETYGAALAVQREDIELTMVGGTSLDVSTPPIIPPTPDPDPPDLTYNLSYTRCVPAITAGIGYANGPTDKFQTMAPDGTWTPPVPPPGSPIPLALPVINDTLRVDDYDGITIAYEITSVEVVPNVYIAATFLKDNQSGRCFYPVDGSIDPALPSSEDIHIGDEPYYMAGSPSKAQHFIVSPPADPSCWVWWIESTPSTRKVTARMPMF